LGYYLSFNIDNIESTVAKLSYLDNYSYDSYYKASQYVPIKSYDYDVVWMQDKPLLYDSRGKVIKKDTEYVVGEIKSSKKKK